MGKSVDRPETRSRQRLLVNGLDQRVEDLPLLVFVTHLVEGIQAPRDFESPVAAVLRRLPGAPATGIDRTWDANASCSIDIAETSFQSRSPLARFGCLPHRFSPNRPICAAPFTVPAAE